MNLKTGLARVGRWLRRMASSVHTSRTCSVRLSMMRQMIQLKLLDITVKILEPERRRGLRCGVVGFDPIVFQSAEAMRDAGISELRHYEGPADDKFHQSEPLDCLRPADVDLIVVCGWNDREEADLADRVSQQAPGVPALRLSRLRNAVEKTLITVEPSGFHSCLNITKLLMLAVCIDATRGAGDIFECGCFLGGTSIFMGVLLRHLGDPRKVHAIDTFAGMPAPVREDGETAYQAGLFATTTLPRVTGYVNAHALGRRVLLHQGLVQDVLPGLVKADTRISFALVDTDQYAGTHAGLSALLPSLRSGGVVVVDDYGVEGVHKAVQELRARHPAMTAREISFNFCLLRDESSVFSSAG